MTAPAHSTTSPDTPGSAAARHAEEIETIHVIIGTGGEVDLGEIFAGIDEATHDYSDEPRLRTELAESPIEALQTLRDATRPQ